jgi:hypothetical protein
MGQTFAHLDAAENAFFERQLEQIRAKTYDIKYPAFRARQLIPVDNTIDPGAETVKYNQYNAVGLAKIVSSYADDLPRADIKGLEFRQPIKSLGASYGYNVQEIRAGKFAGLPLEARKANAARLAVEQAIDRIAALGDAVNNLTGFLNQPNAQIVTIPNGASVSKLWSSKTGLEINSDLTAMANAVVSNTKGIETADTIVVPIAQYGQIASTPITSTATRTILDFFLGSNPWVKNLEYWFRLQGAGVGPSDRMVAYRKDPDALMLVIPQEFEQFPPTQDGLEFQIACHARIGGVTLFYPLSMAYGDGI